MISDLDIYRSANVLLKHHGKDALIEAAMRADACGRDRVRWRSRGLAPAQLLSGLAGGRAGRG